MGDTGSLIIGTIIAILTFQFNKFDSSSTIFINELPAISIAIIIVPVVDTTRIFVIRLLQRRSPFSPDNNHIHHNLLKLNGDNHLITSLTIIAINGLIILFSFLFIDQLGNNLMFFLLLFIGFLLASIPSTIIRWQESDVSKNKNEKKSIFAFAAFLKRLKD
jgi:hypothetical protein